MDILGYYRTLYREVGLYRSSTSVYEDIQCFTSSCGSSVLLKYTLEGLSLYIKYLSPNLECKLLHFGADLSSVELKIVYFLFKT